MSDTSSYVKKILTLCFIDDGARLLLGMKKRGFGEGKWNGFGGKVEAGETIEEAARREFYEEAGIVVEQMEDAGVMIFYYEHTQTIMEVHVFRVTAYLGDLQESEEMTPAWFAYNEIPFDRMWLDDPYWMPHFLQHKKFTGHFYFKDYETMVEHTLEVSS